MGIVDKYVKNPNKKRNLFSELKSSINEMKKDPNNLDVELYEEILDDLIITKNIIEKINMDLDNN